MQREVWRRSASEGERRWLARPIPEGGLFFIVDGQALRLAEEPAEERDAIAQLVPFRRWSSREVALVVAPDASGILLGGYPPLGVAIVADRAEIRVAGESLYVTRAASAAPERIDSVEEGARCARCLRALRIGDRVLNCAGCAAPHHEGERADGAGELRCASYDRCCAGCHCVWEEIHWTPEDIE